MVGVSRYTVAEYLRWAAVAGITWPVPAALNDVALERKPFTPEPGRPQPERARVHAEMRRPGVTLLLLWEEYRAGQRLAIATAGSAISHATGAAACRPPCGKATRPGNGSAAAPAHDDP